MDAKNKKTLWILIAGNLLICLGIGLVIPVTPSSKTITTIPQLKWGL